MSTFEKLIIPFIDGEVNSIDFTAAAGFIDSYTFDPDRPSGDMLLYLVYDDRIRNDYVTNRAIHLDSSSSLKQKYVKLVKGVPYYVYVFIIKPGIVKNTDIVHLTGEQKISVLQFWNFSKDLVDVLVGDSAILAKSSHPMPLQDYYPDSYGEDGLTIPKKGAAS
jgi:hypothetical protein